MLDSSLSGTFNLVAIAAYERKENQQQQWTTVQMEHDDEVANGSAQDETLVDLEEHDEESWIHIILGFPVVGEFLAAIVAMLPTIVLAIAVLLILDTDSDTVINWVILLTLPVTWFWLRYLEQKAGLALCLPLPIVNIRIKWILPPFGLILAYLLITGQTL